MKTLQIIRDQQGKKPLFVSLSLSLSLVLSFLVPFSLNAETENRLHAQESMDESFDQDIDRSKIECCILKGVVQANQSIKALSGTPTIRKPKLTLFLIIENFPQSMIQYSEPYLTGGLGRLVKNGIMYTDAKFAEGNPSSGPSHATFGTGALGQMHGIPNNNWFSQGIQIFPASDYTVLSQKSLRYVANTSNGNPPGQTYPTNHATAFGFGSSNRNLLTDSLADQMAMFSRPGSTKEFFWISTNNPTSSVSFQPAGQLGKAFAFDTTAGGFTSTQAFYPSAIVTITDPNPLARGAYATARVVNGQIAEITVENPGINYTTPTITITDVTTDPQSGISSLPPVSPVPVSFNGRTIGIQGNGTGATATATVAGGQITAITVTNTGSGYHGGLPDWVVNFNNAQNFPSITSYVHGLVYPLNSPQYQLPNISNYSAAVPSVVDVTLPIVGGASGQPLTRQVGTGATAVATVTNGVVTAVTLTNGGSGYTSAPAVTISGLDSQKGVPAVVTSTIAAGVVTSLTIVTGGSGYSNFPLVSIVSNSLPGGASEPFGGFFSLGTYGNKMAFEFLETLIDNELPTKDHLVVFFNFGKTVENERYGLQALDSMNSLYMLDKNLGEFMDRLYAKVDPADVLFGVTGCEGQSGLMQYWAQQGYAFAVSNLATTWRTTINTAVSTATGGAITNLIPVNTMIVISDIWFGPQYYAASPANQAIALATAKNTLAAFQGVRNVYTEDQMINTPWEIEEEDRYLKLEFYKGRSGQLKYSKQPLIANSNFRTEFDYQVPLILYQKGQLENKKIVQPVWVNQIPITIAALIDAQRPQGSPRNLGPLPGIFTNSVTYQNPF